MARLKVKYTEEIAPALMSKFQYKSVMQIPKLSKVIVNVGCGESKGNAKEIEAICKDIATITGQKPITTKARKSVANFKVREGETVGVKVTLRGDKMWEFLDRLFNVALPRVRDFRGINPNSFDGRGNYAFGLKEQLIFPEIEYDKVDKIRGMVSASAPPLLPTKSQGTADHGRRSVPRLIGRKNTMARKAMIARALLVKPKILLLDEPSVGLDPDVRYDIWQEIKKLKNMGISVIITTHYMEEAEYLCDKIAILKQGELLAIDEVEKIKQIMQKDENEDITLEKAFLRFIGKEAY